MCSKRTPFALALERQYDQAIRAATSDTQRDEVISTQAILGDLDIAIQTAKQIPLPDGRKAGITMILAIELSRRGRVVEARSHLSALESPHIGTWLVRILALGFMGRRPWLGYPYL